MKKEFALLVPGILFTVTGAASAAIAGKPADADNFYKSEKVIVQKILFPNQYGMNIAGNLILPRDSDPFNDIETICQQGDIDE